MTIQTTPLVTPTQKMSLLSQHNEHSEHHEDSAALCNSSLAVSISGKTEPHQCDSAKPEYQPQSETLLGRLNPHRTTEIYSTLDDHFLK